MSTMVPELRKLGVDAVGFNFAPRVFQSRSGLYNFSGSLVSRIKFLAMFLYHFVTADVIHWIYGSNSFGSRPLAILVALFKNKKFIEYCGTDVRSLERMCADIPGSRYSSFTRIQRVELGTSTTSFRTQLRYKLLGFTALPNSPEIVDYLIPELHKNFYPISRSIAMERFVPSSIVSEDKLPLVVHVPTNPEIKGSSIFLEAVKALEEERKIRYRMIHNVSPAEAIALLSEADIVVDQLVIGEFGVLSIEAMALEKPVVCFIRDRLIKLYVERDADFPIVNAHSGNLREKLEELARNASLRKELGRRGRLYVERHHSAASNAEKLKRIYQGEQKAESFPEARE